MIAVDSDKLGGRVPESAKHIIKHTTMNPSLAPAMGTQPESTEQRAKSLFHEQQRSVYRQTDHLFVGLLLCQWIACILIALLWSPRTWAGQVSEVHIHVWTAFVVGGVITIGPIILVIVKPGEAVTRHAVAIAQMLFSSLLIHLTGGRIESHFHIFGSLAFLSFYRDWRVLVSASLSIAIEHLVGGLYFPLSVYGVTTIKLWRWLEHVWWVLFEDIFLIHACLRSVKEMQLTALRQAEIETINTGIEETVRLRTAELSEAKLRLSMQYAVASILAESTTRDEAITTCLQTIAHYLHGSNHAIFGAFWSYGENKQCLS